MKRKSHSEQNNQFAAKTSITLDASGQLLLREYPAVAQEFISLAEQMGQEVSNLVASVAQKVLFQLDYWFNRANMGQEYEGQKWLRIALREMGERAFGFVSVSTLSRALNLLETLDLIKVENLNRIRYDQTRSYTLNPEGLAKLTTLKVVVSSVASDEQQGREAIDRFNTMLAEDAEAAAATAPLSDAEAIEQAFQEALAAVCQIDYNIKRNREKVDSVAQDLLKQGYLPLHLRWFERWWKYHSWITKKPGKHNEVPTLGNVTQLLTRAIEMGEREGWGESYY